MMISGPVTYKVVHVPAHDELVLDLDAYWNLDFDGTELPPDSTPTLLYAKVAYPSLQAAQRQYETEQLALEAKRSQSRRRRNRP